MMYNAERLLDYVKSKYNTDEFCCLLEQYEKWSGERPFEGLRLLDGSPLFQNTLAKIAPLAASGAEVVIGLHSACPYDSRVAEMLDAAGFEIQFDVLSGGEFDLVLDCAGVYHDHKPRLGYSELTRSGEKYYEKSSPACFSADRSIIKYFEDYLGTADGLIRALEKLNLSPAGRKVLQFGCGKVGAGIRERLMELGAEVVVVEDAARFAGGFSVIDCRDERAVYEALESAWAVVTVTGGRDIISRFYDAGRFVRSGALLINMGAEDEYGADVPARRVLNSKAPLNFLLPEPTLLRYIDATLALHNEAIGFFANATGGSGIITPPAEIEGRLIETTLEKNVAKERIAAFLKSVGYMMEDAK
ncbi:MAG: NAD(P)-dependent oxidoreductase [Phycisphaerae bacterium]